MASELAGRGLWHLLTVALPPALQHRQQSGARLAKPTLRVDGRGRVRADCGLEEVIARAPVTAPVLGLDWGLAPLLTGVVVDVVEGRAVSDGRVIRFDARAWLRRDHGRRRCAQLRRAKAARLEQLAGGRASPDLTARAAHLRAQAGRDEQRRVHANRRLAEAASAWVVAQALALGCGTVAVEDLTTLEAGGHGRRQNVRLSQAIRSALQNALGVACVRAGLALVRVAPRGTSRGCSRCTAPVRFVRAPDRHSAGYHWARCPACGHQADRDANAAANIARRGLRLGAPQLVERLDTPGRRRAPRPRTSARHCPDRRHRQGQWRT